MADYSGFEGKVNTSDLDDFLKMYVAEVIFVRRRRAKDPSITSKTRRMICTTNQYLLKSTFGRQTLGYKPGLQTPPYNAAAKGLVTVWDILMRGWRNIDVRSAKVIAKKGEDSLPIYVNTKEGVERFSRFYYAKLMHMDFKTFITT